ncbi:MAG: TrmH family RNA methyltransferase [Actinomycetes bacterium]
MNELHVEDPADPRLADYVGLTDVELRRRSEPASGLFMAEGEKVIRRALAAGFRMRSMLLEDKWLATLRDVADAHDAPVYVGTRALLAAVTGYDVHRGALAAMDRRPLPAVASVLAGARRLAVLEDVVDHTNVGAIFRACAAMGVDGVLISPRCADPLYRRAVKVSMGTVFQIPWTRLEPWPEGLDTVRRAGFTVAALALADGAVDLDEFVRDLPAKLALMLGAEGDGLSRRSVAAADVVVRIPMAGGVDSLNVAAAAAVAFWATR